MGVEEGRVRWRRVSRRGDGEELFVDAERLRRSFHTLRGAPARFPQALGTLVGDVEGWRATVETRLRLLQRVVHSGERLPAAEALCEAIAALPGRARRDVPPRSLGEELIWLTWEDPERARTAVRVREDWRRALEPVREALGERVARNLLVKVLMCGPGPLLPLRELLGQPQAHQRVDPIPADAEALRTFADSKVQAVWKGDVPAPEPGQGRVSIAAELVELIVTATDAVELEALALGLRSSALSPLGSWWSEAGVLCRRARQLVGQAAHGSGDTPPRAFREGHADLCVDLRFWADEVPKPLASSVLREHIRGCRAALGEDTFGAFLALLGAVPPEPDGAEWTRGSLFAAMAGVDRERLTDRRVRSFIGVLQERASRAGDLGEELRIQAVLVCLETVLEFEWGAKDIPWSRVPVAIDLVFALAREMGSAVDLRRWSRSWERTCAAEAALEESGDGDIVLDALRRLDGRSSGSAVRLFVRFAEGGDERRTRSLVDGLAGLEDKDAEGLSALEGVARQKALRPAFRDAIGSGVPLERLVHLACLLRRRGGVAALGPAAPEGEPPEVPAWVPEELRDRARELAALCGEGRLLRALGPELRDPGSVAAELAALQRRLGAGQGTEHLERRAEALTARLESAAGPLDASTRERIGRRLAKAAAQARVEAWIVAATEHLLDGVPPEARLGLDLDPRGDDLAVIAGIQRLSRPQRELAFRLLAERAGPEPWDLRREEPNVRWARAVSRAGIDTANWLRSGVVRRAQDPGATAVDFAFEEDPLEVMKMGRWFGTCLSPGDFNFFSTLAVAADLNKRLLVARDRAGTARSRCLLALSAQGHLLAFQVYAHEHGDWYRDQVRAIAAELAASMGVPVAARGEVPCLVARSWYDDGPVDLTGALDGLQPGGALAEALDGAAPSRAFEILVEALGRPQVEASIERILHSAPLASSPDRTASFAPLFDPSLGGGGLPRSLVILLTSRLAKRHPELARRLLGTLEQRFDLARLDYRWMEDVDLIGALLALDLPGKALRVARRRLARSWSEDTARLAVRALEALHRPGEVRRLTDEIEWRR